MGNEAHLRPWLKNLRAFKLIIFYIFYFTRVTGITLYTGYPVLIPNTLKYSFSCRGFISSTRRGRAAWPNGVDDGHRLCYDS